MSNTPYPSAEGLEVRDLCDAADRAPTINLTRFAIPQNICSSARALEVRELGGGKRIGYEQADKEVAELGAGWRLETAAEAYALVDLKAKNQHGAYTRDESLKADAYWTSDDTPWYAEGRFVVDFDDGVVYYYYRSSTAFARAVRVPSQ